jgi:flagellin-like protein
MKRDSAVSPVIGSILLVAITVIIAAVIAAFVFGMTGDVQKTKVVAVTSQKVNAASGLEIQLTNHGGKDASSLISTGAFTVTIDGTLTTVAGLTNTVGSVGVVGTPTATTARQHIVVVGHFVDGTDEVVFDTTE